MKFRCFGVAWLAKSPVVITLAAVIGLAGCSSRQSALDDLKVMGLPATVNSLSVAVGAGDKKLVDLLIKAGVDVNARNAQGSTPLIEAAWHGDKDLVEDLLNEKADVNMKSSEALTPLLAAVLQKHGDVAALLLEKGAAPNDPDKNGLTVLMELAWNGNDELIRRSVEKGANVNYARPSDGATALKAAVANKQDHTVALLKALGAKE